MPTSLASSPSPLAGFDVRRSNQNDRDARRDEINRIEEEFYAKQAELNSAEFVQINDTAYRKSSLLKVTFGDTFIYARFATGDVIEVTGEQLWALTS